MRLWLVRHAQPRVAPGLCYGRSDVPVEPEDSARLARALAAELPAGALLVASPLQRCEHSRQSACGLRPDLASKTDPRLAEMDFGDWEGRTWDAIGPEALSAWTADFADHPPGDGETVSRFLARVAQAYDETRATGRDTCWLTHAGVIRAALLLHRGVRRVRDAAQWPAEALPFGAWRVLEL